MYFGCRNSKVDFIYKEELELLKDKNIINNLRVAFSREGKEKVYVQDLMKEDFESISEEILERKAVVYVCGSKAMGECIKEFLVGVY